MGPLAQLFAAVFSPASISLKLRCPPGGMAYRWRLPLTGEPPLRLACVVPPASSRLPCPRCSVAATSGRGAPVSRSRHIRGAVG